MFAWQLVWRLVVTSDAGLEMVASHKTRCVAVKLRRSGSSLLSSPKTVNTTLCHCACRCSCLRAVVQGPGGEPVWVQIARLHLDHDDPTVAQQANTALAEWEAQEQLLKR